MEVGDARRAALNICLIKAQNNVCPRARSQISQFLTSFVSCNHLMIWDSCFFILKKPSDRSENLYHDFCVIVSTARIRQKQALKAVRCNIR